MNRVLFAPPLRGSIAIQGLVPRTASATADLSWAIILLPLRGRSRRILFISYVTRRGESGCSWWAAYSGSIRGAPPGLDPYSGPGSQDCVRQGGLVLGYYPAAPPGPLSTHFVLLLCNATRRVGMLLMNRVLFVAPLRGSIAIQGLVPRTASARADLSWAILLLPLRGRSRRILFIYHV